MSDPEAVLGVLKHALGWPKCYRNVFVADEGHRDLPALEDARSAMLMIRTVRSYVPGWTYTVTDLGRAFVDKFAPKETARKENDDGAHEAASEEAKEGEPCSSTY